MDELDWGLSIFDGVEVDRCICIALTPSGAMVPVKIEHDASVAFTPQPSTSIMAGRVATRPLRTALFLTRQNRLSPSLSRSMVYVAPDSAAKPEPKMSATAADLTAEDLDQPLSNRNTSTTNNGNGNGNHAVTSNNGHSWVEGSGDGSPTDWSRSFHGLSSQPFDKDISDILLAPVDPLDIEIKPGIPLCVNTLLRSNPEIPHRRPDLPS